MDTYRHGIFLSEESTSITPLTQVASPTVAFGTAPIYLSTKPAINEPVLCHTLAEFVERFGWSDDFEKFTLCEVAAVHFQLFNVSPVIFVNVLGESHATKKTATVSGTEIPTILPAAMILSTLKISSGMQPDSATLIGVTDKSPITIPSKIVGEFKVTSGNALLQAETDYAIADGKLTLTDAGLEKIDGSITFTMLTDTYVELVAGTDYTAAYNDEGYPVITIIDGSKIVDDAMTLEYSEIDAYKVTASDIIGGVDSDGANTGLELVEEIYPRFGLIPGQLIAPKWSTNSAVAAMLKAKSESINGVFKAIAFADLPTSGAKSYGEVNSLKNTLNMVGEHLAICWPKVALDGVQYHLSTQAAALCGKVDAAHDDLPYKSPSNEGLQCDQTILSDGTNVFLGKSQANYLNGCGVVTALNFNGYKLWGNRTSIYPGNADPKDSFISCRRMMNFLGNTLAVSYFSKVDEPINKRLVETLIDSGNLWLNGLAARNAILGGRIELLEADNPKTDLIDGIIRLRCYVGLIPPARDIEFTLEFDTAYLSTLFA